MKLIDEKVIFKKDFREFVQAIKKIPEVAILLRMESLKEIDDVVILKATPWADYGALYQIGTGEDKIMISEVANPQRIVFISLI